MEKNRFKNVLSINGQQISIYDITRLQSEGVADIDRLPFSIRILVENLLRKMDGDIVTEADVRAIAGWQKKYDQPVEIPHHPARVLMQDFTGVPAVVDLAVMRDAIKVLGGDPAKVNPLVPSELVVDHSVQVDYYGSTDALKKNVAREYERNGERYALLKWAQNSFTNLKVVPPNSGICHQVNLEHLSRVIINSEQDGEMIAYPDSLVGLDSHSPMVNGIGVMAWGVGGIEAEAVMLGQPYYMSIPEVIGVEMTGRLAEGITATDMVLRVTQMLREQNVVEKFVEFFGSGVRHLSIPDRATIANMAPEYGATMGFFPVDEKTIHYLKLSGRGARADLVEACSKALGLFYNGQQKPDYTTVLKLDLSEIQPAIAGPSRPQDRILLPDVKSKVAQILECTLSEEIGTRTISRFMNESGSQTTRPTVCKPVSDDIFDVEMDQQTVQIGDGSIVIAAITSCTNTSNPFVMLGAGLVAKKAAALGLTVPPYVKTSLAPGSKVVRDYLEAAGLMAPLNALGFHLAAFGCTTCIGNSGPLHPAIERTIMDNDLNVAAVLSGNRNFEARIHQHIKSNFIASPMLVVAYALAGRIDTDLTNEPLGHDPDGNPVYFEQIWPKTAEIEALVNEYVKPEFFAHQYGRIFDGDEFWRKLPAATSTTFDWHPQSTYIRKPPYFEGISLDVPPPCDLEGARVLMVLGDSVTTDHISPAGAIPEQYPAGAYLLGKGVAVNDFNSYGSRRGNHEVMMRGTFGNIRIKNKLVDSREGSYTRKFPENKEMYVYEAAMAYQEQGIPLVVLGGKEYGSGSSRDWAAKGSNLLGVKAVIANSFERIHRSNLVGMGVLPLVFEKDDTIDGLGLDGSEVFSIQGIGDISPRKSLIVTAAKDDGQKIRFPVTARLDTQIEVDYFIHGGILPYVLRKLAKQD